MRWSEVSDDPNSRVSLNLRAGELVDAHTSPVDDRVAYLASRCKGLKVLDCGVVAHRFKDGKMTPGPLYLDIAAQATEVVGIDILEREIAYLAEAGFHVKFASITDPALADIVGDDFDILVGGEIIEHIDNPGMLFENARRVLKAGGVLILTTPNPYCARLVSDHLRGKVRENVDHVAYFFPSGIAELAARHGFILSSYRGARDQRPRRTLRHLLASVAARVLNEDINYWTYIYELTLAPGDVAQSERVEG